MVQRHRTPIEDALFESTVQLTEDISEIVASSTRGERLGELKGLAEDLYHLTAALEAQGRRLTA